MTAVVTDKYDVQTDARTSYWNGDYMVYWRDKLKHANSAGDDENSVAKNTANDNVLLWVISKLGKIENTDIILDLGTGTGRALPALCSNGAKVVGLDISKEMIELTRGKYDLPNLSLHVAVAESVPTADNYFSKVLCYGTFDATYQEKVIKEIHRVLQVGGVAVITGKNTVYSVDDEEAILAERGARRKGHPNYFTDLDVLLVTIDNNGFVVQGVDRFLKRGDMSFGKERRLTGDAGICYEYILTIQKIGSMKEIRYPFSNMYSKTWRMLNLE